MTVPTVRVVFAICAVSFRLLKSRLRSVGSPSPWKLSDVELLGLLRASRAPAIGSSAEMG